MRGARAPETGGPDLLTTNAILGIAPQPLRPIPPSKHPVVMQRHLGLLHVAAWHADMAPSCEACQLQPLVLSPLPIPLVTLDFLLLGRWVGLRFLLLGRWVGLRLRPKQWTPRRKSLCSDLDKH